MSKTPLGKQAGNIFAQDSVNCDVMVDDKKPVEATEKRGRGRPTQIKAWSKTTTVLTNDLIFWLDSLSANIRRNSGKVITRSELIRAFASAVEESGLDLSEVSSVDQIKNLLAQRLNNAK